MADVGLDIPVRATALRRAKAPAVLLAVIVVGAALLAPSVGRWARAGAPFKPSEMNISLGLAAVPVSELQQVIESYGVSSDQLHAIQPAGQDQEAIVGQLSFTIPKPMPAESQLALFVIDERSHRLVQSTWGFAAGAHHPVSGYDGGFGGFAQRYPWLRPTAFVYQNGEYTDPGMAISLPPGVQSRVTFYAVLDPNALPVTDVSRDVSVTLGFVGPDRQIYWAHRISPSDSGQ